MSTNKDLKIKAKLMDKDQIAHALKRIAHQIIEKNDGCDNLIFFGIKRGGIPLAKRLASYIDDFENYKIPVFDLDITQYRDDIKNGTKSSLSKAININCDITNKAIVLVDDVIFTGRTVRAALNAIVDTGRASLIQLAVLIDRGHRELPIRADYVGKNVPTSRNETILVNLEEFHEEDSVDLAEKQI